METAWWIDHGPYYEFRRLVDDAPGPVHRRRLRHQEHPRSRQNGGAPNHAWGSAFRAYGSPQAFLSSEIAMDILGRKENPWTRWKLRYKNVSAPARRRGPARCLSLRPRQAVDMIRPAFWQAAKQRAKDSMFLAKSAASASPSYLRLWPRWS